MHVRARAAGGGARRRAGAVTLSSSREPAVPLITGIRPLCPLSRHV